MAFERGRRRGWLRQSFHFLIRSLTLRASSFILALLAVTVGAAVSAVMLNLKADLGSKMARELRRYGPNLLVTPAGDTLAGTLDEFRLRALQLEQPALQLIASGRVTAGNGRGEPATIVGAEYDALRGQNPTWRIDGAWPAPGDQATCVIGAAVARRAGISAGDRIHLNVGDTTERLMVTGLLSTGESEEDTVYVALSLLQRITGLAGRVSLATLSVDGGSEAVSRAASAIDAALPGAEARPLRPIAAAQGAILGKLDRMMFLLTLVVLLLSGLCLTTTLMSIVLEREPEIGLMRSLGAGDAAILSIFLGEVSLLGLLGGGLGLGLGLAGAQLIGRRLFDAAIDPRPDIAPLVLGVALVLCWISVLVPMRRALAIQPAAALRGE